MSAEQGNWKFIDQVDDPEGGHYFKVARDGEQGLEEGIITAYDLSKGCMFAVGLFADLKPGVVPRENDYKPNGY